MLIQVKVFRGKNHRTKGEWKGQRVFGLVQERHHPARKLYTEFEKYQATNKKEKNKLVYWMLL